YAGVAPALGSPSGPGHTADTGGPGSGGGMADSTESTMLRPAGSALGPAASATSHEGAVGAPEQQAEKRRTPAWPFVTLAAVLVVVFGVGASLGVRHFLVTEPDDIETSDITAPTQKPEPPGEPT